MAATELTVTVEDEGFYSKDYKLKRTTRLRRLFERYFDGICIACTDHTLLEFWYQATRVVHGMSCIVREEHSVDS